MKKATQKKLSTRTKIYALLDRTVKPKEIAKRLNIPVQSVYSAKYLRWKTKPSKTITVSATTQKATPESIQRVKVRVELEDKIEAQNIEIVNLKHQIIGFRAVISYLEDLAGVRNSQ